jgi:RNA polymerase sigma factor for flagellar operon FliA
VRDDTRPRSSASISDLWPDARHCDRARNKIACFYQPLVKDVVGKLMRNIGIPLHVPASELESDGNIGLLDAIRKFEPARRVKFETYASRRIRGAILDSIRDRDWVPRLVRQRKEEAVRMDSLSKVVFDDGEGKSRSLGDLVCDAEAAMAGSIADVDRRDWFACFCRGLDPAETLIVRLYFEAGLTMREVGMALGLCESRISQMLSSITERLRATREEE